MATSTSLPLPAGSADGIGVPLAETGYDGTPKVTCAEPTAIPEEGEIFAVAAPVQAPSSSQAPAGPINDGESLDIAKHA